MWNWNWPLRPTIHQMRNTRVYFLTIFYNCLLKTMLYCIHDNITFDFWTFLYICNKTKRKRSDSVLWQTYGSIKGTRANLFLFRAHDLLFRSQEILYRSHEILFRAHHLFPRNTISFPRHSISWERDSISWERNNKWCARNSKSCARNSISWERNNKSCARNKK